jgi:hypothetical protein
MFCSQCAHKLTPSDVYCPKCSKPIASFNFDPGQIPQVEYVGDEELTAVRMPQPDLRANPVSRAVGKSAYRFLAGPAIGAAIATLGILLAAAIGYIAFIKPTPPIVVTNSVIPPTPDQSAETRRAEQAARDAQIAVNKAAAATPVPTKTPIDIDAERAKIEEREQRQRQANAVANAANAANSANYNAANTAYNVPWPPPFDKRGRRLRAICNSGTLSYWQGDKDFTCMVQGGVRVWYW